MSQRRSAVSRRFIKETETALAELLARDLSELHVKVLMLDGDQMRRAVSVYLELVALERAADDGLLVIIDRAKSLRAAVTEIFGTQAAVQRGKCDLDFLTGESKVGRSKLSVSPPVPIWYTGFWR